jgi:hypothetical protein
VIPALGFLTEPTHVAILVVAFIAIQVLGGGWLILSLPGIVEGSVTRAVRGLETSLADTNAEARHANRNAITVHGEVRDLEKRMAAVEEIIHKDCPLLAPKERRP